MIRKRIKRAVDTITEAIEWLTGFLAFIMMVSLMWQVFTRFVIKTPSIWTEEIARYSFIYMAMLGASVGVKKSTHFGMTLLTEKLRGRTKVLYNRYVVNGIILVSSVIILIYGWDFAIQYGLTRVSPTFLVPMTWVFMCMPLTAAFMILFSLYNIFFEENLGQADPQDRHMDKASG